MRSHSKFFKQPFFLTCVAVFAILASMPISSGAQSSWWDKATNILETINTGLGADELSTADISGAFKEALHIGTENVVQQLGRTDGFHADPAVRIPLPDELNQAKNILSRIGMASLLEDLELKLNRAAEAAAPKAKSLFWNAITEMKFDDVKTIYKGPENAATTYLQNKMSVPLSLEMRPIIENSLSQVGAIQSYDKAIDQYQAIPFVPDVKANLTNYVVEKGLEGIFYYIAREEAAIRRNPARQTTDLLKRVFGAK